MPRYAPARAWACRHGGYRLPGIGDTCNTDTGIRQGFGRSRWSGTSGARAGKISRLVSWVGNPPPLACRGGNACAYLSATHCQFRRQWHTITVTRASELHALRFCPVNPSPIPVYIATGHPRLKSGLLADELDEPANDRLRRGVGGRCVLNPCDPRAVGRLLARRAHSQGPANARNSPF